MTRVRCVSTWSWRVRHAVFLAEERPRCSLLLCTVLLPPRPALGSGESGDFVQIVSAVRSNCNWNGKVRGTKERILSFFRVVAFRFQYSMGVGCTYGVVVELPFSNDKTFNWLLFWVSARVT